MIKFSLPAFCCGVVILMSAFVRPAWSEVSVSLVIEGDVDEIQAVLNQLRRSGLVESGGGFNPFRMRVHSSTNGDAEGTAQGDSDGADQEIAGEAQPGEPAKPTVPPVLGFSNLAVAPNAVAPGNTAAITVDLLDRKNQVDTVAAMLTNGSRKFLFDLYDNGTHGDETAGDSMWSVNVTIPATADPGPHTLQLSAYDTMGDPIMLDKESQTPLGMSVEMEILSPEDAQEPAP